MITDKIENLMLYSKMYPEINELIGILKKNEISL